jgi:uncharacterized BrkB/YihY/UPF0761 family membrane protein
MDSSNRFFEALWGIAVQLPSLLTMLACIVVAVIRWKRHPKVSVTLVIGLVLLVLHTFVFAFVYAYVPDVLAGPGNYAAMRTIITVISFIYNSSLAIAIGILLAAVFMQRNPSFAQPEESGTPA